MSLHHGILSTAFSADISRRRFVFTGVSALVASALSGCDQYEPPTSPGTDAFLTARPGVPTETAPIGESALGIETGRDGLLYVPASYTGATAVPLVVLLHGAGSGSAAWRDVFKDADGLGFVMLAPDARGTTWDRIRGGFGADVGYINAALAHTFAHCRIDASHVLLAGFSDGATYALSLGVGNGDLFTHLAAFSPGFIASGDTLVGKPRVFVSHGTEDPILNVASSRDNIVPLLRSSGYDVTYREFDGGHEVPRAIFDEAMAWFVA